MSFADTVERIIKSFETSGYHIPDELVAEIRHLPQGHKFVWTLHKHLVLLDKLKRNEQIGLADYEDKRGWVSQLPTLLTLSVLNKDLRPGDDYYVVSMGGEKRGLVVYYGLCPELENFASLKLWIDTKSSKELWKRIRQMIKQHVETKTPGVIQFSKKIALKLPNELHPAFSRDSQIILSPSIDYLYDWRSAFYLFDDGATIGSHSSPVNYRQVIISEKTLEASYVDLRITIGYVTEIQGNQVKLSIPVLVGRTNDTFVCSIYETLHRKKLRPGGLYFLQVFRKTDDNNISIFIRECAEASIADIVGLLLAMAVYNAFVGSGRMRIMSRGSFEMLCSLTIAAVTKFCIEKGLNSSSLLSLTADVIYNLYLAGFSSWIDSELYYVPPLLHSYLREIKKQLKNGPNLKSGATSNTNREEFIISRMNIALEDKKSVCFERNDFVGDGRKLFSGSLELIRFNRLYSFIRYNIEQKRLILGYRDDDAHHEREAFYFWISNYMK